MRVLLIGAAGQFGQRIAAGLAREPGFSLILAGRTLASLQRLRGELAATAAATLDAQTIDVDGAQWVERLRALAPDLVIHTAGPFQTRDYELARACVALGAHYIDLADAREFVTGIGALDAEARAAGRWVITGASSVPALSSAVVDAFAPRFARLQRLESAISPGNRTDRGLATTRAILGYVGRPYRALIDGQWRAVHGWQAQQIWHSAELGKRWVGRCEVPDLDLLPARWPTLAHCDFRAGLELRRMHYGLWLTSWAVRFKLIRNLAAWASPLLAISRYWQGLGSDRGGMRVLLEGAALDGGCLRIDWQLVAGHGDGPQVPATAAVLLARKIARGELPGAGATPCIGLLSLAEFVAAWSGFDIRTSVSESLTPR